MGVRTYSRMPNYRGRGIIKKGTPHFGQNSLLWGHNKHTLYQSPGEILPGAYPEKNWPQISTRWLPGGYPVGFRQKTSTRQFFTKKTTNPANYHIVLSRPGTRYLPGRFLVFYVLSNTRERFVFMKKVSGKKSLKFCKDQYKLPHYRASINIS